MEPDTILQKDMGWSNERLEINQNCAILVIHIDDSADDSTIKISRFYVGIKGGPR